MVSVCGTSIGCRRIRTIEDLLPLQEKTGTQAVHIGRLKVLFGGDLHGPLRTFLRPPVPSKAFTITPELEVSLTCHLVEKRSWEVGFSPIDGGTRKGLDHHCLDINFLRNTIEIRLLPEPSPAVWYYLFRDLFCGLCALSGDPLIHSSAVAVNGQAFVFCAYSGGGKSTLARLLQESGEAVVINDEINWAFLTDDGVPFLVNQSHWTHPASAGAQHEILPLSAIYLLKKARVCGLAPVSPTDAFPLLLGAPYGTVDTMLQERSKRTVSLIRRVPVSELSFSLDPAEIRAVLPFSTGQSAT